MLSPGEIECISLAGVLICAELEVMNSHLVQAHLGYAILTAAMELACCTPRELFLTAVNIGYELECHKIHQSLNLSSILLKISD